MLVIKLNSHLEYRSEPVQGAAPSVYVLRECEGGGDYVPRTVGINSVGDGVVRGTMAL